MEYIIQEFSKNHNDWCLFHLAGRNLERAKEVLKEQQKLHPDKQLRIEEINSKEAWWNVYGTH